MQKISFLASWSRERCLCPWLLTWIQWYLEVAVNPKQSMFSEKINLIKQHFLDAVIISVPSKLTKILCKKKILWKKNTVKSVSWRATILFWTVKNYYIFKPGSISYDWVALQYFSWYLVPKKSSKVRRYLSSEDASEKTEWKRWLLI